MDVIIGDFPVVHRLAEINVGGVGSAVAIALARERIPSQESPVEAPVKTLTWKGFPFSCSASAIFASAAVTAFGRSGGRESAQPNMVAMLDQACCFFWCQYLVTHVSDFCWMKKERNPV